MSSALVTQLTDESFESEVTNGKGTYMVDFWAPWCGPCKIVAPFLDELAADYEGKLKVGKVNIDDHQAAAQKHNVISIPTILVFKDGELKERINGAVPKATLKQHVDKVL